MQLLPGKLYELGEDENGKMLIHPKVPSFHPLLWAARVKKHCGVFALREGDFIFKHSGGRVYVENNCVYIDSDHPNKDTVSHSLAKLAFIDVPQPRFFSKEQIDDYA